LRPRYEVPAHPAICDRLTQTLEPGFFHLVLEYELHRAWRYEYFVSLLIVEMDKSPPDQPQESEQAVLQTLVDVLRDELRGTDLIGRVDTYKFAVLLPYARVQDIATISRRIQGRISHYIFPVKGAESHTVSIGSACFPTHATEAGSLLTVAETALARATQSAH
jgi:diguanylate cyclase (GGDEF)-like protein